jgi:hypothetical protein
MFVGEFGALGAPDLAAGNTKVAHHNALLSPLVITSLVITSWMSLQGAPDNL